MNKKDVENHQIFRNLITDELNCFFEKGKLQSILNYKNGTQHTYMEYS